MLKDLITQRVLNESYYIVQNNSTIRATALVSGVSKSTVYKDVTERLLIIDFGLYSKVQVVLQNNKHERASRGGQATKVMYLKRKGVL